MMVAFLAVAVGAVMVACAPSVRSGTGPDAARHRIAGVWTLTVVGALAGVAGSSVLERAVGWWALAIWLGMLLASVAVVAMYRWSETPDPERT